MKIKIQITDIFDFYLLRQNQDLSQNCENVIQEWVDINFSLLNYIFTILRLIFNFLLIIFENILCNTFKESTYACICTNTCTHNSSSCAVLYPALVANGCNAPSHFKRELLNFNNNFQLWRLGGSSPHQRVETHLVGMKLLRWNKSYLFKKEIKSKVY